jgi:hypothetical protein
MKIEPNNNRSRTTAQKMELRVGWDTVGHAAVDKN